MRVQLELNLQITELWLKVQPSTPPKVREHRIRSIQTGLEEIGQEMQDCTSMLNQVFDALTSL